MPAGPRARCDGYRAALLLTVARGRQKAKPMESLSAMRPGNAIDFEVSNSYIVAHGLNHGEPDHDRGRVLVRGSIGDLA